MTKQPREPFVIGTIIWPGVAKLIEETGELQQVLAKLVAFPHTPHPDGTDLVERLQDELGDVVAAMDFLIDENDDLDADRIAARAAFKRRRFQYWHDGGEGLPPGDPF